MKTIILRLSDEDYNKLDEMSDGVPIAEHCRAMLLRGAKARGATNFTTGTVIRNSVNGRSYRLMYRVALAHKTDGWLMRDLEDHSEMKSSLADMRRYFTRVG